MPTVIASSNQANLPPKLPKVGETLAQTGTTPIADVNDLRDRYYAEKICKVMVTVRDKYDLNKTAHDCANQNVRDQGKTIKMGYSFVDINDRELGQKRFTVGRNGFGGTVVNIDQGPVSISIDKDGNIFEIKVDSDKITDAAEKAKVEALLDRSKTKPDYEKLYQFLCRVLSSPEVESAIQSVKGVVAEAVNSKSEEYSEAKIQNVWRDDVVYMRLLSGAIAYEFHPDDPELFNNQLFDGLEFIAPEKIAVSSDPAVTNESSYFPGLKVTLDKKTQELVRDQKSAETLDLHTGGETSVRSFAKLMQSGVNRNAIELGNDSSSAYAGQWHHGSAQHITPQLCKKTRHYFGGRPSTLVGEDLHSDLYNHARVGVGVIFNPRHKTTIFTHGATENRGTGGGAHAGTNQMIFTPMSNGSQNDPTKFTNNFAKGADSIAHRIRSENVDSDHLLNPDYGVERNNHNEQWGTYSPEGVIGITMLDLSPKSAAEALTLLESHYPGRPIVRYSYLTNSLIAVDPNDLRKIVAGEKSHEVFVTQKLQGMVSGLGESIKASKIGGATTTAAHSSPASFATYSITINQATNLGKAIAVAGNSFFGAGFSSQVGGAVILTLQEHQLADFEDFLSKVRNDICVKPQLLDLTVGLFASPSSGGFGGQLNPKITSQSIELVTKNDLLRMGFDFKIDGIYPETPCFTFPHPVDSEIQCVTFVVDKKNYCAFFDKTQTQPKLIGKAFSPLLQKNSFGALVKKTFSKVFSTDTVYHHSALGAQFTPLDIKKLQEASRQVGKRQKVGVEVYLTQDSIGIGLDDGAIGGMVLNDPTPKLDRFEKFMGDGFAQDQVSAAAGAGLRGARGIVATEPTSAAKDVISFRDGTKAALYLRLKDEKVFTETCEPNSKDRTVTSKEEKRKSGWKYNDRGEIEIVFNNQTNRDNFIRAFNGDALDASGQSMFSIDPTDQTKLFIRKKYVDEMEKIDPNHGRKKSLKLFVDLSETNEKRRINFDAMTRDSANAQASLTASAATAQSNNNSQLGVVGKLRTATEAARFFAPVRSPEEAINRINSLIGKGAENTWKIVSDANGAYGLELRFEGVSPESHAKVDNVLKELKKSCVDVNANSVTSQGNERVITLTPAQTFGNPSSSSGSSATGGLFNMTDPMLIQDLIRLQKIKNPPISSPKEAIDRINLLLGSDKKNAWRVVRDGNGVCGLELKFPNSSNGKETNKQAVLALNRLGALGVEGVVIKRQENGDDVIVLTNTQALGNFSSSSDSPATGGLFNRSIRLADLLEYEIDNSYPGALQKIKDSKCKEFEVVDGSLTHRGQGLLQLRMIFDKEDERTGFADTILPHGERSPNEPEAWRTLSDGKQDSTVLQLAHLEGVGFLSLTQENKKAALVKLQNFAEICFGLQASVSYDSASHHTSSAQLGATKSAPSAALLEESRKKMEAAEESKTTLANATAILEKAEFEAILAQRELEMAQLKNASALKLRAPDLGKKK